MQHIAIYFDELGNLRAGLERDKKLLNRWLDTTDKLTATGASALIHIILISQPGDVLSFGVSSLAKTNVAIQSFFR